MFSNTTCLSCLARSPQNSFNCGHSFCDSCVMIHGSTPITEPWCYTMGVCPLCGSSNDATFNFKPYTAGVRCLSAEGGGRQDILVLKKLEMLLKLSTPISDFFDMALGSGSGEQFQSILKGKELTHIGALLLLAIFCKEEWGIDDCMSFAHLYTEPTPVSRFSTDDADKSQCIPLQPLLEWVRARPTLKKSGTCRKTSTLGLKDVFEAGRTLFQCSGKDTKIALTTMRRSDSSQCLLSNFNRPSQMQGPVSSKITLKTT